MFILKKIEYKVSAVLAVFALVLSPLVGIISGINAGVVVLRTALMAIFFAGIGFVVIFVLKRFVPEVYSVLNRNQNPLDMDVESIDAGISGEQEYEVYNPEDETDEDAETVPDSNHGNFDPGLAPSTSESLGIKDRAMGRHILEERGVKYEPKIMAEAIRTMMSKDEK
ncbi:MAG TPA: hypothetical protein P5123_09320 [Spirochaetota bacterium]|nr:hypothetical protein [Spirochaetota bacterium]